MELVSRIEGEQLGDKLWTNCVYHLRIVNQTVQVNNAQFTEVDAEKS